jgi:predicted MFS family arabinose efflux permease
VCRGLNLPFLLEKHKGAAKLRFVRHRLAESLATFRDVFRNPNLRRLQLAFAGSVAGQYAFTIAIAVYAYGHGGAAAVGIVALVRTIPSALLAPFVSALGDRFPQERVMVAADALRAVLVAAIAVVVFADGPTVVAFFLAALTPICATAFHPAEASLLPVLARSPEELTATNVSTATIESVGSFVGPAIGGLALAAWGVGPALLLTVGAYLWSGALVFRVRPDRTAIDRDEDRPPASAVAEALAGFRAVLSDSNLRVIVGLFGAQTVVAGAMGVLVVVAALRLLDLGTAGVGWLYAATGIGGIVGAAVSLALTSRKKLAADFRIGLVLWGVPFVALAIWPNTVVALLMLGVLGLGNTLVDVSGFTLVQRNAPDAVRARVFGVLESVFAGTIGLGAILAPLLIGVVGIRTALFVTGVFLPVLVGLSWRRLAALDSGDPAHLDLLKGIPLFAPLAAPALERLVRSLAPVHVAAGDVLFSAGDAGDRYYVVEAGELGVQLATGTKAEGPGRGVGEIALLRDVPRTATVQAIADSSLLALEREDFLAAVTGSGPASAAAHEIVGERLALSPV